MSFTFQGPMGTVRSPPGLDRRQATFWFYDEEKRWYAEQERKEKEWLAKATPEMLAIREENQRRLKAYEDATMKHLSQRLLMNCTYDKPCRECPRDPVLLPMPAL
jgi:hypothetical protein